ncbi:MAG: hypothetical protein PHF86_11755 [Candidatus Nanoarchaeia archaeon]|jgi:hypothetical protein|nr:hypothetical protein [Candidatus Nanoarchaeia archaeon]
MKNKIYSLISVGILPRGTKCKTRTQVSRGNVLIDEVWKFIVYPLKKIYRIKGKKTEYINNTNEVHFPVYQYQALDIEILRKQLHEHVDFICNKHADYLKLEQKVEEELQMKEENNGSVTRTARRRK